MTQKHLRSTFATWTGKGWSSSCFFLSSCSIPLSPAFTEHFIPDAGLGATLFQNRHRRQRHHLIIATGAAAHGQKEDPDRLANEEAKRMANEEAELMANEEAKRIATKESQISQALQKLASANALMEKMMVQLNKNCERTSDLLHEILQDQKKSHNETWQFQRDIKMALWHIQQKVQNMEMRQSLNNPDTNDALRHTHQAASGQVWGVPPACIKRVASLIDDRVTSIGQLPAECDHRRGQFNAVEDFLKANGCLPDPKADARCKEFMDNYPWPDLPELVDSSDDEGEDKEATSKEAESTSKEESYRKL